MAATAGILLLLIFSSCAKAPDEIQTKEEPLITADSELSKELSADLNAITDNTTKTETAAAVIQDIWYNSYTIDLEVDPSTRIVTGLERISYKNKTLGPIDTLYINVPINAFSMESSYTPFFEEHRNKIYQYGIDYATIEFDKVFVNNTEVTFTLKDTVLEIHLNELFEADRIVEIVLGFTSKIPKISHRTGANDEAMWLGGFIPTLAVRDENGVSTDKYYSAGDPFFTSIANYTVSVTTPLGYTVVGTGSANVTQNEDKLTTVMSASMVRDFALTISDSYQVKQIDTSDGKTVNFYHYSEITNMADFLLAAKKSLEFYSRNIGEYPYNELNIVECELFFECGMEFSKLIMIDSNYLKNPASIQSLTHEVGHQWFYNVVGSDQIRQPWLDEGIVMFLQQEILYDKNVIDEMMKGDYAKLKTRVSNGFDSRLSNDLSTYENWSSYYRSAYTRGKLMIYSLKNKIGDENFATFIKAYYTKNAFKISSQENFIELAEKYLGDETAEFFQGWIYDFVLPDL